MQFETFAQFVDMGGHGLYVWLCYGVGFAVLGANLYFAIRGRAALIRDLAQKQRRDAQLRQQRKAQTSPQEEEIRGES